MQRGAGDSRGQPFGSPGTVSDQPLSQGRGMEMNQANALQQVLLGAATVQGLAVGPQGLAIPVANQPQVHPIQLAQATTGDPGVLSMPIGGHPTSPVAFHHVQAVARQLQAVSPEMFSVADYISQPTSPRSPGAATQRHILTSPVKSFVDPRTGLTHVNLSPSISAAASNPFIFQDVHRGYCQHVGGTQIHYDPYTVQPFPSPNPQPMGTVHHHGHGPAGSRSPVRSLSQGHGQGACVSNMPGQRSPHRSSSHSPTRRMSSGGRSPIRRGHGTPSSIPISPSRTNPLPSSPVKTSINIAMTQRAADVRPPSNTEVAELRRNTLDEKRRTLKELQNSYNEKLTELFFLQHNQNMMDYLSWKRKPPTQLTTFLASKKLEERTQERNINDEVKVLTSGSSNIPLSTPVAISKQLPPEVSALTAQQKKRNEAAGDEGTRKSHHGTPASVPSESRKRSSSQAGLDEPGEERSVKLSVGGSDVSLKTDSTVSSVPPTSTPSISVTPATPTQVAKPTLRDDESVPSVTRVMADPTEMKLPSGGHPSLVRRTPGTPAAGPIPSKGIKSPLSPTARERQATRQQSLSAVYDYTIGSQEMIVERAKQEAQVMQRIAELRKDGLWSAKRLPRVQEPPRHKTHWDYLLEEMQWLAADFAQERRWKRNAARKLVRSVARYHQEQQAKEMKAEKEEVQKLKRIAGNIAKEIKAFWVNIEKVVQYKQQSRLDERRKKALDLQLDFIVGQTEKYSSWLTEGLNTSTAASSVQGSIVSSPRSDPGPGADDAEFRPQEEDESDDEETIDVEEKQAAKDSEESEQNEIELLQKESELPIEELLSSLHEAHESEDESRNVKEMETKVSVDEQDGSLKAVTESDSKVLESQDDEEFVLSADEEQEEVFDDEKTLDEEEEAEGAVDHKAELDDLAAEGELPIEELLNRYQRMCDEGFELPASSDEESDELDSSAESSEDEEEEEEEEEGGSDNEQDELKDVGMEYLINPEKENEDAVDKASLGTPDTSGPNREITDIAAAAQSLQPTGYTLSDTQVKTKVPFLLRHKLREYQHIGLDWLVTMHEKKLNGILADEMGLGKTIQTIAMLSHLACEDSCWGPHLIVVPTSVMLNWEMELKKWCPAFKILTYYGNQKERKQKRQGWTKTNAFHVCITSYKLVIQDHQSFRRKKWKYLVLDEAQNIKNFKSQRWQTLLNFSSQRRLLLTGTPLQNNLMELWSLMHFLMPHVFQSHREFKEWFSNPLGGMIEGTQEYNEGIVRRLHKVLRPFLLRRLKSQVEKQLPQKYEHVIRCRLSKRQRYLYDDFMSQTKTKETLATGHFMSVINVLMQLRKVCNHPDLFESRPIISPFHMEGILYYTASLVHSVMEYNPLEHVSLQALNLCIADLELSLPAYTAHRTCQLQTPRKLIEEIDSAPDPPPRPPKVKVKPGKLYPSPMALQAQKEARASPSQVSNRPSGRASPTTAHIHGRGSPTIIRVASPVSKSGPASPGLTQVLVRSPSSVNIQGRTPTPPQGTVIGTTPILQAQGRPGTPPVTLTAITNPRSPGTITLVSQNPQPVPSGTPLQQLPGYTGTVTANAASPLTQQRVLLQQQVSGVSTNGRAQFITTQPITVQLQPGSPGSAQQSGGRLIAGQIRQLPQGGIVQIIQTSGGQQIIRPAVQLTSQTNLANSQRASSPQLVQRPGTPQMVLGHTAAQLQAAQQLHQSIQRQLTAQGVSPSQAQAVASQLSKVTAAQSPIQLQQRQLLLQQQQQQKAQQPVVISQVNAQGNVVQPTPAPQAVTNVTIVSSSSVVRPSSPVVTTVQAVKTTSTQSTALKTISKTASIPSAKVSPTVAVSSPGLPFTAVPAIATTTTTSASLPSGQTGQAGSGDAVTMPPLASLKVPVVRIKPFKLAQSKVSSKDESKEAREAAALAEKAKKAEKKRKSSPLYLESLDKLKAEERKAALSRIATFNQQRCNAKPVYGQDLFTAVSLYRTSKAGGLTSPFNRGAGIVHCYHSLIGDAQRRVEVGYDKTNALRNILHSPEDRLKELEQITKRYVFVVPAAQVPPISMHTSHTPPSVANKERILSDTLNKELNQKTWCLHPIENSTRMNIPELRLIQYDCGKLQTLDILLRRLKSEGSRVLIFTQMTKMLDVLERFLNYHGHIYLRLDGGTKVEQRQVLMERFNKDQRIFCFILSTRSGGIGVNLTGANTVIFYDSDWNPTMDAQAQDRCHRIGQTRDVHIYRLISEMTIEENILKKSNQKRLLIDVSIEGGNFTTAFFKTHTIREIFEVSKGADRARELLGEAAMVTEQPEQSPEAEAESVPEPKKPLTQSELEKALARAEDETDVNAASRAHAEQDAELAEFDETIPYEGEEGKGKDETSKVEIELAQLDNQLTPIERYAVHYLEETLEPVTNEQLKEAEEQVEAAKKEWELSRLQALKEQEERNAELGDDGILFTYSREDSMNQVHKSSKSARRRDRDKVKGSEKSVKETRRSGRNKGSKVGSPPPVVERPTRNRSRANSGASVTDNDLPSRRTRSRASSGSGSDKLPSPRPGDRASRMAEREKRRDSVGTDGKSRRSSGDKMPKSPERVMPRRGGSGSVSKTKVMEDSSVRLRKARSPDPVGIHREPEVTPRRSARSPRQSVSDSDHTKQTINLEPLEEISSDLGQEELMESKQSANRKASLLRRGSVEDVEMASATIDHEGGWSKLEDQSNIPFGEGVKESSGVRAKSHVNINEITNKCPEEKMRNIFDIVDNMRIKEKVKPSQEAVVNETAGATSDKFEKWNKNLIADFAKRFRKKAAAGQSAKVDSGDAKGRDAEVKGRDAEVSPPSTESSSVCNHESSTMEVCNDEENKSLGSSGPPQLSPAISESASEHRGIPDAEEIVSKEVDHVMADIQSVSLAVGETAERPNSVDVSEQDSIPEMCSSDQKDRNEVQSSIQGEMSPDDTPSGDDNQMILARTEPVDQSEPEPKDSADVDVPPPVLHSDIAISQSAADLDVHVQQSISDDDGRILQSTSGTDAAIAQSSSDTTAHISQIPSATDTEFEVKTDKVKSADEMDIVENDHADPLVSEAEVGGNPQSESVGDETVDKTIHEPEGPSHETDVMEDETSLPMNKTSVKDSDQLVSDMAPSELLVEPPKMPPADTMEDTCDQPNLLVTEPTDQNINQTVSPAGDSEIAQTDQPTLAPCQQDESEDQKRSSKMFENVTNQFDSPKVIANNENASPELNRSEDAATTTESDQPDVSNAIDNPPILDQDEVHVKEANDKILDQETPSPAVDQRKKQSETVIVEETDSKNLESKDDAETLDRKVQNEETDSKNLERKDDAETPVRDSSAKKLDIKLQNEETDSKNLESKYDADTPIRDGSDKRLNTKTQNEDTVKLLSPPKPTRSVREIIGLTLPGERPVDLKSTGPSTRTRSRNSGDTIRTRSRSKNTSSPFVSSIFTPLRSKSPAGSRSSSQKNSVESKTGPTAGKKKTQNLGASDTGVQTRTRKSLRSSTEPS